MDKTFGMFENFHAHCAIAALIEMNESSFENNAGRFLWQNCSTSNPDGNAKHLLS